MKRVLLVIILLCSGFALGQTGCVKVEPEAFVYVRGESPGYVLRHKPKAADRKNRRKLRSLAQAKPSEANREDYYALACSLWELGKLDKAEKMLLEIVACREGYYDMGYAWPDSTSSNAADIHPTVCVIEGFRISMTPYKHNACIYLARIYVEQQRFDEALQYLYLAEHEHAIFYAFGVGQHWNHYEIDGLFRIIENSKIEN